MDRFKKLFQRQGVSLAQVAGLNQEDFQNM